MTNSRSFAIAAITVVALGAGAIAATLTNEKKLVTSDLNAGSVGMAVAIDGTTAVVTAPNLGPNQQGAAYVFIWDGAAWIQQAKLLPTDNLPNVEFGSAAAISGDTILIGQGYAITPLGYGVIYVFERSGNAWTQTAKLQFATPFGINKYLGYTLALEKDTAVAAVHGSPGSAVVFNRVAGVWDVAGQQILTSSPPGEVGDTFPSSDGVAIQGDIIAVGSPGDTVEGLENRGTVRVYERDGQGVWSPLVTLSSSDTGADNRFGSSIGIDGDTIAVGADGNNMGTGAVYVFKQDGGAWTSALWSKILPSNPQAADYFGRSIALHDKILAVGNGLGTYLFDDLTGTSPGQFFPVSDAAIGKSWQLGFVSMDSARLIWGSPFHGGKPGAAYIYNFNHASFPRIQWTFTLWPYKYIYMGCPLDIVAGTSISISLESGTIPLTYEILERPAHGTLRFAERTLLVYQPDRGFTGHDAFSIKVTGRDGNVVVKTADVTVEPAPR